MNPHAFNHFYGTYSGNSQELQLYITHPFPTFDPNTLNSFYYCQNPYNITPTWYQTQPETQHKVDSLAVQAAQPYQRSQKPSVVQKVSQINVKLPEHSQKLYEQSSFLASNEQKSYFVRNKVKKPKLKKNTQANIVNNIISFLSIEVKSHHLVKKFFVEKEKMKIFYIFMNNLKKMNNKYLNKKILEALLLLQTSSSYEKMLQKSVKRLQILPLQQLRIILRKIVFSYLRGPYSIFPLFTSKKICRVSMNYHLEKRRHLTQYLLDVLKRKVE